MQEAVFIRFYSFSNCFYYITTVMKILHPRINVCHLVIIWRKNIRENGDCILHKVFNSLGVK